MIVRWTNYLIYKSKLRGFDLAAIEQIVKYSSERYRDTITGRLIAVGRYNNQLVVIPYEIEGDVLIPITIHVSSRQQIHFRIQTGRFTHE